jgi:putative transposase
VQHDRDSKFSSAFDEPLKAAGAVIIKSPYRSPNLCAFVERVIQTIRVEALDHFIVFGQRHLDHIISVFAAFYNERRPHQSKDNLTLPAASGTEGKKSRKKKSAEPAVVESLPLSQVRYEKQLGGLLKHYYRNAA